MEILRPFWHEKLQRAWSRVPIAWLSGVRRVGRGIVPSFGSGISGFFSLVIGDSRNARIVRR